MSRLERSSLPQLAGGQVIATEQPTQPADLSTDQSSKYQPILSGENIDYNSVRFCPGLEATKTAGGMNENYVESSGKSKMVVARSIMPNMVIFSFICTRTCCKSRNVLHQFFLHLQQFLLENYISANLISIIYLTCTITL